MWLELLEVFFIILIAILVCMVLFLIVHYPMKALRNLTLKVRDYLLRTPR